jgi:hypothetical protein
MDDPTPRVFDSVRDPRDDVYGGVRDRTAWPYGGSTKPKHKTDTRKLKIRPLVIPWGLVIGIWGFSGGAAPLTSPSLPFRLESR